MPLIYDQFRIARHLEGLGLASVLPTFADQVKLKNVVSEGIQCAVYDSPDIHRREALAAYLKKHELGLETALETLQKFLNKKDV
jgi:hypothetical protein